MKFLRWNLYKPVSTVFFCVGLMATLSGCYGARHPSGGWDDASSQKTATEGGSSVTPSPSAVVRSDDKTTLDRLSGRRADPDFGSFEWVFSVNPCGRGQSCDFEPTPLFSPPVGLEQEYSYRFAWRPLHDLTVSDTLVTYGFSVMMPPETPSTPNNPLILTSALWTNTQGTPVLMQRSSQGRTWIEFVAAGIGTAIPENGTVTRVSTTYPNGVPYSEEWNRIQVRVVWSNNPSKGLIQWVCNGKMILNFRGKTLPSAGADIPVFLLGGMLEGAPNLIEKATLQGLHFDNVRVATDGIDLDSVRDQTEP